MTSGPIRPVSDDAARLLRSLARVADEHPLERKILVAPKRGAGRELLRALARARGGWTGFVVETPRPLALQLAGAALGRHGLRLVDEFEEEALVDQALDEALQDSGADSAWRGLVGGVGFRRSVRSAVVALRLAGVEPGRIRRAPFRDRAKRTLLADTLHAFERGLEGRKAVDVARVLELATDALRAGAPLPGDRVDLVPGLSTRGVAGRFVQALVDRGAGILATDPVVGAEVPSGWVWRAAGSPGPRSFVSAPGSAPWAAADPVPERAAPRATPPPTDPDPSTEGLPLFDASPPAPPATRSAPAHDDAAGSASPAPGTRPPPGGASSSFTLFRAAGVQEELREVLRRVMGSGRPLDDVEIITPDPGVYGPALHALAARLDMGVTFAVGLPVERTRPGRAVAAWLRWIGDDFPSPEIRRLLENDDLRAPGAHREVNPRRLARRLRRLRIGWGRERYGQLLEAALERLRERPPEPRRYEEPDEYAERLERTRAELEALQALFTHLLRRVPREVPRRVELHPRPVAPADLARALTALLTLVPTTRGSVDATARERLLRVLDRIAATLTRPAPFGAALGTLQDHLELRVPAPRAEGKAPWLSDGGSLHLTDLEHGGLSGRPLTFLVGLDAGRFPGPDTQDPLLLDRERGMLSGSLPTSAERLREARFEMAALLARLRGEVVLSYPAWDAAEGRVMAPSPLLLQAFRLAGGDPDRGFEDLRSHLGVPRSRLPRPGQALDREDVWLGALSAGDHLLAGGEVVRAAFPRLDRGLEALDAWRDGEPGPHHGLVEPRPELDPRRNPETVLSASRLETLGACPLRYFQRYVLRVRPPDDPEYRPDAWLDPLARGSLLHRVYEITLRVAREDGLAAEDTGFVELARRVVREQAERMRVELPPPSDAVYRRELAALEEDMLCFADLLRRHPAPWKHLERRFGPDEPGATPVALPMGSGTIRLRGAVDRIDSVDPESGSLRVVDYKTGRVGSHWARSTGVYSGGRRLQHLLYTLAVEAMEGRPVEAMEYHFPTRKGEGEVRRFRRSELEGGSALVTRLLELAAAGRFLPTDDKGDCRFCDFQAVCRVRVDDWSHTSPPADWGRRRRDEGAPAYDDLAAVRGWEEGGS